MTLFDVGPTDESTLTARQSAVLRAARDQEGVGSREAGIAAHKAGGCRFCSADQACKFAESDGNAILRRLRTLGHVRYRAKLKTWHAVRSADQRSRTADEPDPFPEGF